MTSGRISVYFCSPLCGVSSDRSEGGALPVLATAPAVLPAEDHPVQPLQGLVTISAVPGHPWGELQQCLAVSWPLALWTSCPSCMFLFCHRGCLTAVGVERCYRKVIYPSSCRVLQALSHLDKKCCQLVSGWLRVQSRVSWLSADGWVTMCYINNAPHRPSAVRTSPVHTVSTVFACK